MATFPEYPMEKFLIRIRRMNYNMDDNLNDCIEEFLDGLDYDYNLWKISNWIFAVFESIKKEKLVEKLYMDYNSEQTPMYRKSLILNIMNGLLTRMREYLDWVMEYDDITIDLLDELIRNGRFDNGNLTALTRLPDNHVYISHFVKTRPEYFCGVFIKWITNFGQIQNIKPSTIIMIIKWCPEILKHDLLPYFYKFDESMLLFLINSGMNINSQDKTQTTLLYATLRYYSGGYYIKQRDLQLADKLLSLGADPFIRNDEGKNCFDLLSGMFEKLPDFFDLALLQN